MLCSICRELTKDDIGKNFIFKNPDAEITSIETPEPANHIFSMVHYIREGAVMMDYDYTTIVMKYCVVCGVLK
jgi:hypothetical protein